MPCPARPVLLSKARRHYLITREVNRYSLFTPHVSIRSMQVLNHVVETDNNFVGYASLKRTGLFLPLGLLCSKGYCRPLRAPPSPPPHALFWLLHQHGATD